MDDALLKLAILAVMLGVAGLVNYVAWKLEVRRRERGR
jgi:heme/copper-type cytochrome/quinol oxidase subunit 2